MASQKEKIILKLEDESFIHQLIDLLKRTGRVRVTNLGIFEIKNLKARQGFNVYKRKIITIPKRNKIVFKPLKVFKDSIE